MISTLFQAFAGVIVMQLVSNVAHANPSQQDELWVNPCAGSDRVGNHRHGHHHRLRRSLGLLRTDALIAARTCTEIMEIIIPYIGSSHRDESLIGFPPTDRLDTIDITSLVVNYYERLSRAGVFVDQITLDTWEYEDNLDQLENKYRDTLCDLSKLLDRRNREVTSQVTRDIMPRIYIGRRFEDIAVRHERNYLIIRDARRLFVSISESAADVLND